MVKDMEKSIRIIRIRTGRTTIANVVSGIVIIAGAVYAYRYGDAELLKSLCLVSAGYLFGVSAKGAGQNGR
jgi:hypothetical protein